MCVCVCVRHRLICRQFPPTTSNVVTAERAMIWSRFRSLENDKRLSETSSQRVSAGVCNSLLLGEPSSDMELHWHFGIRNVMFSPAFQTKVRVFSIQYKKYAFVTGVNYLNFFFPILYYFLDFTGYTTFFSVL